MDSKVRLHEGTRTLLLTALDDPDLLGAIGGGSEEGQKQRRYRQLWLNHIEMIFRQRELFDKAHWQGTLNDVRDFMEMPHMRSHWATYGEFYSANFREFMEKDVLLKKVEKRVMKKNDMSGKAETSRPKPEASLKAAQSSET
ncbi:hypothetical protein GCM10007100_23840 [Roseibacillus persicicus]|uniref:Uncharacterized protein n=2 Tax=Roseibacillus persicicus TaxID=454148 RepID=A0A918WKP3_9BACT|nr:hypothetical protein GCM10007100_23840 [Roseibacillus persicicus]